MGKWDDRRFRVLFTVSFFTVLAYLVSYGFARQNNRKDYRRAETFYETITELRSGVEAAAKHAVSEFVLPPGYRVTLTIDPELQNSVNEMLTRNDLPTGAFVAIEPATGRILAMSGYSSDHGITLEPDFTASFPAASLVKIITASAALEELDFSPASKISYRSGLYKVTRLDLKTPETKRYPRISLTEAMAKSANNVFGKLTAKYVGRERFVKYLKNFLFFKKIPFEFPVEESIALVPEEDLELARTGAGFGKVMISPLHAAMMGASIANGGIMMRPYIVESIRDGRGNLLFTANEEAVARTVSPETADKLVEMMTKTPILGTLRKAFSKRKWRYFVKKFDVAGKTGSITWGPPRLRYEWSLGMAPAKDPSICFVSLTGNSDLWYIKSTVIAREALAKFFDYDYKKIRNSRMRKGKRTKKRR